MKVLHHLLIAALRIGKNKVLETLTLTKLFKGWNVSVLAGVDMLRIKGGDSCLPACTKPRSAMPAAFFIGASEMVVVTTFLLNLVGLVVCLAKLHALLCLCFHIWKTRPFGNKESFFLTH